MTRKHPGTLPPPWQSARTLGDLGQLTARWLEGDLAAVPGYGGAPDLETLTLVPVLAAANRAGYVTSSSQPGMAGGVRGWDQRASLEGFADRALMLRLTSAVREAGLVAVAHDPARLPRWRARHDQALAVTRCHGKPVTSFGAARPRGHLRDCWTGFGECHPDAIAAVCAAWQVTLIDPQWGRPGLLWQVLRTVVSPSQKAPGW